MIRPRLAETTTALGRAVRGAGLTFEDVGRVVLVGGTSRIPLVAEMVTAATGRPVAVDVHPKQVVALGAARVAGLAVENPGFGVRPAVPARAESAPAPTPIVAPLPPSAPTAGLASPEPSKEKIPPKPIDAVESPRARRKPPVSRRVAVGAGAVVVVALLAAGAFALFGGGGTEALAAEIDDIELIDNAYEVTFATHGFQPSRSGTAVAFYWDSSGPSSGTAWTSRSAFDGFSPSGRPSGSTRICIIVIEEDGTIVSGSGNCRSVPSS